MPNYSKKVISPHKTEITSETAKVPVVFHLGENLMPEDKTIRELIETASQPNVFHHVAALSDIHSKKGRRTPTGSVTALKGFLAPQINDTAPNCGMRLIKTGFNEKNLSAQEIDKLFREFVKTVPTKKRIGTVVPQSLVMDACRFGTKSVKEYFKTKCKKEVENSFANGNFFESPPTEKEILDAVPELFLKIGRFRLGILGAAGNHFLDLMKVTEIKDPQIAEKFGISEGQYILLLHTGSGLLGQYASYLYTPKKKEHLSQRIMLELGKFFFKTSYKKELNEIFRKIKNWDPEKGFLQYTEDSLEGKLLQTAHNASANIGFANRAVITHNIQLAIENVLGNDGDLEVLYDMPHVFMRRENHFGEDVWVHRNGASRACSGEPVFIPSSMGTPAYLGVGTDENQSTFFSASHGTGRKKQAESTAAKSKGELLDKMKESGIKLYNAKSSGVVLQDKGYYKDAEQVIETMEANKIVKVVAKMQPVAVLMY